MFNLLICLTLLLSLAITLGSYFCHHAGKEWPKKMGGEKAQKETEREGKKRKKWK